MRQGTDRRVLAAAPEERGPLDATGLTWLLWGAAAFQYLSAATELGLLDLLAAEPGLDAAAVARRLGLAERPAGILLLGATTLGLVERAGDGYRLGDTVAALVAGGDGADWRRFRDIVAFEQHIVYQAQVDFAESLRRDTNVGLRRIPGAGRDLYHRLAEHPALSEVFYRFMRSWSELVNHHLVERLDLAGSRTLLDCGGGDGVNAIALARAHPGLRVTVLEIEAAAEVARRRVADAGLADRVDVLAGDMFAGPLPRGFDCILFAHQFVIWPAEDNTRLLREAHDALDDGGRVAIFNSMAADTGDGPFMAAMCSVYFASLPAAGGKVHSWAEIEGMVRAAGFASAERIACPGWTPTGLLVATKRGA